MIWMRCRNTCQQGKPTIFNYHVHAFIFLSNQMNRLASLLGSRFAHNIWCRVQQSCLLVWQDMKSICGLACAWQTVVNVSTKSQARVKWRILLHQCQLMSHTLRTTMPLGSHQFDRFVCLNQLLWQHRCQTCPSIKRNLLLAHIVPSLTSEVVLQRWSYVKPTLYTN